MHGSDERKTASPAATESTSKPHDLRSGADWIASGGVARINAFLDGLEGGALLALPYLFEFWALPHQLPPEGQWRSWVILGGRGAGKTRAGSEWVRAQVEGARPMSPGRCKRIALVGETLEQVRSVMVHGDSGIIACSPPDRVPTWIETRKALVWPNGAEALAFSAHDPERLRGPQFDGAWVDELAKWRNAQETWDMLQFGLRLGDDPRVCVTTTPRNVDVLKRLLDSPSTVKTHAPTEANRANLADGFLAEVRARYANTRLGRQELDGVLLDDVEGAMWTHEMLDRLRATELPEFDRIVVAVDPPVTGKKTSDECGIVVAGVVCSGPVQSWRAVVLEDASVAGASPNEWAARAVRAFETWKADRIVAEVNQGGDLVAEVLRAVGPQVPVRKVHATRGKHTRAEPVAACYERGQVKHWGDLGALEDQMCRMTQQGYEGKGSPDRLDALVWALTDLMAQGAAPKVRTL